MSRERLTVTKGGVLRYRYRAGGCMDFSWNMLCEVGQRFQAWFREEIKRRGLNVEYGVDIDHASWCVDRIKRN